ncbi:MAG: hypothetical protein RI955_371 [Bacteroidota bacterium]
MSNRIYTVYLADDHQIVIDGLRLLFSTNQDFAIIGTGTDGKTAFKEIKLLKPDIAIIDVRMPLMDGIELIKGLQNKVKTKFIVLSMYNQPKHINAAINCGSSAYLFKNTGQEEMLKCIYKVIDGYTQFPEIPKNFEGEQNVYLSSREISILKLIIQELSSVEIANKLHLSIYTVDTHRKNILKKTNTKSSIGLVKYASENGIIADDILF